MASIKITQFGGIAPSVDPRNLPADGAQAAVNLDLRFGDFRPMKGLGTAVATVPVGTKSIFRTPSGVWLSSTNNVNWVNGQIPDAASERVYLTGRSAYPEAWQGGAFRRLGVPAPTVKPTVLAIANGQFDADAADAAQQAAANAVVSAITAIDTQVYLGNAVPASGGAPATFDPDYAKVALHLDFAALVGGEFEDKSPQKRATTKDAGATLLTDNTGPLGVAGTGCGAFNGSSACGIWFNEIVRHRDSADPTWTIDAWVTATATMDEIGIEAYASFMRKVVLYPAGGGSHQMLFGTTHTDGGYLLQLRCRRASGLPVAPAGVPVFISVQCTSSNVQVFIDGELCGSTPRREGLEMGIIGQAANISTEGFNGKMDEVRVTLGQRYTGNFTRPTLPFPTSAVPTGTYLAHGAIATLPTDSARDAAYLIQLVAAGAGFAAVNAADNYLRDFDGAQVTYTSLPFWAVALAGYRADGLAATESNISTAIAAVDNPASPGTPLLDAGQVALLAPLLFAAYDISAGDLSQMLLTLNAAQAELRTELARAVPIPTTVAAKILALTTASNALTDYFTTIETKLRAILAANEATLFGSINSAVVTRDVQTRTYIATYITDWDEESAPSPAADLLSVDQNDQISVTIPEPPADRNIVGWRLYRSATSSTGASWALVADTAATNAIVRDGVFFGFTISNRVYADGLADQLLQEPCATITWAEPPENLQGLVGMPNGVMVGFYDRTLCFSESFAPYAWPVEYQLSLEHKIVGIGVFGQTAVVLTEGFPYYVSGADAASMSAQKIEVPQSCIAAHSIASVDGGVVYASPDGLCLASPGGIALLTQGAFSKADWQAQVTSTARGAFHDGAYYLFTD